MVYLPSCGHRFHGVCLYKWKLISPTCPLCRVVFELPSSIYTHYPTQVLREILDIQSQIIGVLTEDVRVLKDKLATIRSQYICLFTQ
jgi:hypothetical protein